MAAYLCNHPYHFELISDKNHSSMITKNYKGQCIRIVFGTNDNSECTWKVIPKYINQFYHWQHPDES